MVQPSRQSASTLVLPANNVPLWLENIAEGHTTKELDSIEKACHYAIKAHTGQTRKSGEDYVNHTFAVAALVHELGLDYEAVIAALLHDVVEDTPVTLEELEDSFGANVARMVDGVTKMEGIQEFSDDEHAVERFLDDAEQKTLKERNAEQGRIESLRKMMLAMVEDVRVVLIKLCDRLHNMRTMESMPPHKQVLKSRETLDIFAPLANRLGVWQLKWELEDLAFRYLEPEKYQNIAKQLSERRVDRDKYVSDFVVELENLFADLKIDAAIKGRSKHIYSIWSKMSRKQLDFDNVHDIRAVRVLVDSVQDCYAALGVVHTTWKYVPGEFDDYIATPKENNYQSIHTSIIGPKGRVIEIQIRTHDMHKHNELGVAAHWRYKESGSSSSKGDSGLEHKILWLRQLMEWKDEVADASEFVDRVKDDVFEERIYVFTPKGKVIDLPKGATPLDFAYAIHTQVGHTCRGALVNEKMVPLTSELRNGQRVSVLTNKNGKPSLDWLSTHHHYLTTRRARSAVQHYFRHENRDQTIAHGRELVDKELHRMNVLDIKLDTLAKSFGLDSSEDLFLKVADGSLKLGRVSTAANRLSNADNRLSNAGQTELFESKTHEIRIVKNKKNDAKGDLSAEGVDNLLMQTANCCHPLPGEPVAGFITKVSGISVHRQDCSNLQHLEEETPERVISVGWHRKENSCYPMSIAIEAFDRRGLLSDVATVFTEEKINVIETSSRTDPKDQSVHMVITAELPSIDRMSHIVNRIMRVQSVHEVRRKQ